MLPVINLILAIGLLVAGRKLFWLFVAAAGFFAGVELATRYWQGPEWVSVVAGILLGLLLAGLAMALKSIAIGVAGFLLGGSVLTSLAASLGFERGEFILYIVGGILGIIFIGIFFDWALIVISSLAGASILVRMMDLERPITGIALLILVVTGILIQFSGKHREKGRDD